jgi:hypothetical protein
MSWLEDLGLEEKPKGWRGRLLSCRGLMASKALALSWLRVIYWGRGQGKRLL